MESTNNQIVNIKQIAKNSTNLYDLNDHCLLSTFKYLDQNDLLNIVDTCKRFYHLGRQTFVDKYKRKEFSALIEIGHYSYINDKKMLCRFGNLIPDLKVHVRSVAGGLGKIFENICFANICELKLCRLNLKDFQIIQRTYPRLIKAEFLYCSVMTSEDLAKFLEFNPQIESLTTSTFDSSCIKYKYHLKELQLSSFSGWKTDSTRKFINLKKLTFGLIYGPAGVMLQLTSYTPHIRKIVCTIIINVDEIIEIFRHNKRLTHFKAYSLDPQRVDHDLQVVRAQAFRTRMREVTSNRRTFSIELYWYKKVKGEIRTKIIIKMKADQAVKSKVFRYFE